MVATLWCRRSCVSFAVLALVIAARPAAAQYQLKSQPYVTGLSLPVGFVQDPSDPTVQFVVQQGGHIRAVKSGVLQATDFLDVSGLIVCCGEQGLLGLAFPPDYASSGRFYINYTEKTHGDTVVARYKRSAGNPLIADGGSEKRMVWQTGFDHIIQPYTNHNGGHLAFGADGYLYIGMGDGGSAGDPEDHAQLLGDLLGKMLRIDVSSVAESDVRGYRVPADNPMLGRIGAYPEIWDLGLRNPWQFSFDPATGALVIGDVGQDAREEIDYEPAGHGGRNYGWSMREGMITGYPNFPTGGVKPVAPIPFTDPILDYDHTVGHSITGGVVYRGAGLGSAFNGRYFYGDYVAGRVWSLALTIDAAGNAAPSDLREHTADLGGTTTIGNISAFGTDAAGEVYVVSYSKGTIFKISSAASMLIIDQPRTGTAVVEPFVLSGWTIDARATINSGIDAVYVWAFPAAGPAIYMGGLTPAGYTRRDDVAAIFGPQFAMSGYQFFLGGLEQGRYLLGVYGHSIATGQVDVVATTTVDVSFSSRPLSALDAQLPASTLQPFTIAGWSIDYSAKFAPARFGTGIDSVYVQIVNAATNAVVVFAPAQYGRPRPDVAAAFGDARFTNSGFSIEFRDLMPGSYRWSLFSWDNLTGRWAIAFDNAFTLARGPMVTIDAPQPNATVAQPFTLRGWAVDLRATSGTGVDAIGVWAYPASGASPTFVGGATLNQPRPDVGAILGSSNFNNCGYALSVGGLAPGGYTLVVWVHSTVTGTWAVYRPVGVTVQ